VTLTLLNLSKQKLKL